MHYLKLEKLLEDSRLIVEESAVIRPPFASPAGKMRMAVELASKIPTHKTYVEPFAGSSAVFFAKPRADIEVLNDLDSDVSGALKALASLSTAELNQLTSMDFTGSQAKYHQVFDSRPTSKIGKLYRFLYLTRFSMNSGRGRTQFNHYQAIKTPYLAKRVPPAVERLKGVKIHSEDYESVCRRYDSPETFFFLDPPYAGFNALKGGVSEKGFNEDRFFELLRSLKGKWLLNYGTKGRLPAMLKDAGFKVRLDARSSTANIMKKGKANGEKLTHLIASNY